jgi:hypothetical protein
MSSDTRKNKLDPAEGTRLSATDLQKFSPKNKVEVVLAVQYARLRANAPDPAKHPIFRPLWEGFVLRIESYLETPQENRSLEKLAELEEFRSWVIGGKRPAWTGEHETFAGNVFVERGATYGDAQKKISEVRKLGSGRPRSNVAIAIRGLELKTLNPSLHWRHVANQVCDCGRSQHDDCLDRLNGAVVDLRSFMKKYGLSPQ